MVRIEEDGRLVIGVKSLYTRGKNLSGAASLCLRSSKTGFHVGIELRPLKFPQLKCLPAEHLSTQEQMPLERKHSVQPGMIHTPGPLDLVSKLSTPPQKKPGICQ